MAKYNVEYSQPVWEVYTFTAEVPDDLSDEEAKDYIREHYDELSNDPNNGLYIERVNMVDGIDSELEISKS